MQRTNAATNPTGAAAPQTDGRLYFNGQAPGNGTSAYYGDLSLCPNPVNVSANTVAGQPYIFEFKSSCAGNGYNLGRPPYRYTLKYTTVGGNTYIEEWAQGFLPFSIASSSLVRFYLFDRVPQYQNATNQSTLNSAANTSSGNANFGVWSNTFAQTAAPGEVIESLRIEGSGYTCGSFWPTDDRGNVDISYYTMAPKPVTVSPLATTLCRDQVYTLTTAGATGATGYTWTASNGARVVNGSGFNNQVTLNLSNVPPTAADVTISVRATNPPSICGGPTSAATTLTFPLSAASAPPQSIKLIGGTCPSTAPKQLNADFVSPTVLYRWKLIGAVPAGTYLTTSFSPQTATTGITETSRISLTAPTAGAVTVSAEAFYNGCSGISTPLVQTFQITQAVPQMPRATGPATWCVDMSNRVRLAGTTGATYSLLNVPGLNPAINVLPAGTSVTSVTQSAPGSAFFNVTLGPDAAGNYPTSFSLLVVAAGACPGTAPQTFAVPVSSVFQQTCIGIAPGGNRLAPPVQLYPNPTTGLVQLLPKGDSRYAWVKVADAQGRTVLQESSETAAGVTRFDLKALPTGLYDVQLFDGKQLTSQRLVKE